MMAVIQIDEVSETPDGPELRETAEGGREYVRTLQVKTKPQSAVADPQDEYIAGPRGLLDLLESFDVTTKMGAAYAIQRGTLTNNEGVDSDINATLIERTPRRDRSRRDRWEVRLVYSTKAVGKAATPITNFNTATPPVPLDVSYVEDKGDWFTERPIVEIQFIDFLEAATQGQYVDKPDASILNRSTWIIKDFGAITNSASDPILDPAPEVHREKAGLNVIRNVSRLDISNIFLLMNSVNAEPVRFLYGGQGNPGITTSPSDSLLDYTMPRFGGRISMIMPELRFRGGDFYYRVTYTFDILDNTDSVSVQGKNDRSWVEQWLDRGFLSLQALNQPVQGDLADFEMSGEALRSVGRGQPAQMEALLCDGKYKVLPTFIDSNGQRQFDLTDVCYRNYILYDLVDWRAEPMFKEITNNAII